MHVDHLPPSRRSSSIRSEHVPALDGLRGTAILGVLLFHTTRLPGGFLGVDLFFVLSGYLITGLLLREISERGTIRLVAFWGRRFRRLLPALATMLVVVTLTVSVIGSPDLLRSTVSDGPWVQANLVNWHLLAQSTSYWEASGQQRVFEHLWSIAVEEQFYLVWPVVIAAVARWSRRPDAVVLVVASVGAVVSALLMALLVDPSDSTRVYTGTDTRGFALLLGAAAATAPMQRVLSRAGATAHQLGSVFLVLGMAVAWIFVDGVGSPWLFRGGLAALSAAAALLIILVAQPEHSIVGWLLAVRPLRWAGAVSYSTYLWHWPVIIFLSSPAVGLEGWPLTLTAIATSLTIGGISKVVIEDPIRFHARWARGRTGFIMLVLVMFVLIVLWVAVPPPAPPLIELGTLK